MHRALCAFKHTLWKCLLFPSSSVPFLYFSSSWTGNDITTANSGQTPVLCKQLSLTRFHTAFSRSVPLSLVRFLSRDTETRQIPWIMRNSPEFSVSFTRVRTETCCNMQTWFGISPSSQATFTFQRCTESKIVFFSRTKWPHVDLFSLSSRKLVFGGRVRGRYCR